MKNKKKSSRIDHTSCSNRDKEIENMYKNHRFYPGVGKEMPNDYKAAMILPDGYRAACHLHKKPLLFKTLEEANEHMRDVHRVWKG